MTVKELIIELQKYPEYFIVLTPDGIDIVDVKPSKADDECIVFLIDDEYN